MKLQSPHNAPILEIYSANTETSISLPLTGSRVTAGFPSPADDFLDSSIDLNKELIKNKASTFYGRVRGESMKDVGINDGDLASTKLYYQNEEDMEAKPRMYNSPKTPRQIGESGLIIQQYDTKSRNTLISDQARVYKGGSWKDREYWLDPAQRRYLPQYMATNFIGFRCATDRLGSMTYKRRKPTTTKVRY